MVHRLPRKQLRITDLLLRTESEFADGVKHQHPVIAHIVILCPHRVYTTAADDRLVDLIVKFLYFIFVKPDGRAGGETSGRGQDPQNDGTVYGV